MGLKSIELTKPDQWPTLEKHGLICAMTPSHGIGKGLNRIENHEECLAQVRKAKKSMVVYGLSEHYVEIFKLTRLADFMTIYDNQASALAV